MRATWAVALLSVPVTIAVADGIPRFVETRAQDLRVQMEDVFANAGVRMMGVGQQTCGPSTRVYGWVQCGFFINRGLRLTILSDAEESDAQLILLTRTRPEGVQLDYFMEPASYIVRTIDYELSEPEVYDIMNRLAAIQYDLDRYVEVRGKRGIYLFKADRRGFPMFEVRPILQ